MDYVNIGLALVLVAANGFFVATEFAIARLRPGQVAKWVSDGRPGAKSVEHAIQHIDEVGGVRFCVLAAADAQIQELRLLSDRVTGG